MNTNEVRTGDTDDNDDEQVGDWGSEYRCGDKRILGSVVKRRLRQTGADEDCVSQMYSNDKQQMQIRKFNVHDIMKTIAIAYKKGK